MPYFINKSVCIGKEQTKPKNLAESGDLFQNLSFGLTEADTSLDLQMVSLMCSDIGDYTDK